MWTWEKIKHRTGSLVALGGAILFVVFLGMFGNRYYQMTFYGDATYAVVDSVYTERGSEIVAYSFTIDGKKYSGTAWYDVRAMPAAGDMFEVKYSTIDPTISRLQMEE